MNAISETTQSNQGVGEEPSLSIDDAHALLSNHCRRFALHHLKRTESAELGELSEQVAAWENDVAVGEIDSRTRKNVYTSLQQHHLPKLDEKGVVSYDERSGEVELSAAAEELDIYLEVVSGNDIPWSQYYLGLSAVSAALMAAVWINVIPLPIGDLGWMAFVVAAFTVSSLAHTYESKQNKLGGDGPPEGGG